MRSAVNPVTVFNRVNTVQTPTSDGTLDRASIAHDQYTLSFP
jgi:hypothetical protein